MPVKVLQNNDRIAEVQFICDCCGKLVRTSIIPKEEAKKTSKVICWQCKQASQRVNGV